MIQNHFWKDTFFDPFLTHFGCQLAHFQGILGVSMKQNPWPRAQNKKWVKNGSKRCAWTIGDAQTSVFSPAGQHMRAQHGGREMW